MTKKRLLSEDEQTGLYREMLVSKRKSVLADLGTKVNALAKMDRVCDEDLAQHSLVEAVSIRLNGFEYVQLRQIQEALDRLQIGDFGTCLSCEEAIPMKRLQVLPWAKYCVKCQERIAANPLEEATE